MDILFGGSKSTTGPVDVTPDELKGIRGPFADAIKKLFDPNYLKTLQGQAATDGAGLAAPLAEGETAALAKLRAQLDDPTVSNYLRSVLSGDFLPGQGKSNPFLQSTIESAQRPTLQGLTETLERSLPGRFTQAGQFIQPKGTSAFDRAAGVATRGAADALGDIASRISFGTYESERGRQQEAVGLSQQEVETTIANLQAQGLPRLIQDLGIERGLAQFQERINAVLQALAIASGTLVNVANKGSTTTTGGIIPALFPKGL